MTKTDTPPLLVFKEGAWWIEVALASGQDVVLASVGDGSWLLQQIVEKLVLPRLRESTGPAPVWYDWVEVGVDAGGPYKTTRGVKTYDEPADPPQ